MKVVASLLLCRCHIFLREPGVLVQRLSISSFLTAFVVLSIAAGALAQEYPVKPIRMVVPLPPGGGTGLAARVTGKQLTLRRGLQVIIDQRARPHATIRAAKLAD